MLWLCFAVFAPQFTWLFSVGSHFKTLIILLISRGGERVLFQIPVLRMDQPWRQVQKLEIIYR